MLLATSATEYETDLLAPYGRGLEPVLSRPKGQAQPSPFEG